MAGDTANSVVVYKQCDYRGQTKIWSNRHHFDGDLPADPAHWDTLMNAIVLAEKAIYDANTEIVKLVGYDASSASTTNPHGDAVYAKDYTTVGTFVPGGSDVGCPGDAAMLLRFTTNKRSAKNHPVYLMNYFHGAHNTAADADHLVADQLAAVETYGTDWISGFSDGAETHHRCGPDGTLALTRRVDPFIRHRDFRP